MQLPRKIIFSALILVVVAAIVASIIAALVINSNNKKSSGLGAIARYNLKLINKCQLIFLIKI